MTILLTKMYKIRDSITRDLIEVQKSRHQFAWIHILFRGHHDNITKQRYMYLLFNSTERFMVTATGVYFLYPQLTYVIGCQQDCWSRFKNANADSKTKITEYHQVSYVCYSNACQQITRFKGNNKQIGNIEKTRSSHNVPAPFVR